MSAPERGAVFLGQLDLPLGNDYADEGSGSVEGGSQKQHALQEVTVRRKQITKAQHLGQQGVNLIEKIVLEMGNTWTQTGALEAGVDGYIELRDHQTGEMSNLIIQVQSKATAGSFQSETDDEFSYSCRTSDIYYWRSGNAPVILVVSRPSTGEAYWKDVKGYFERNPDAKTIRFRKSEDRFDYTSAPRLISLGASQDTGLFLVPPPKDEVLTSSLVEVTFRKSHVWSAPSRYQSAKEAVEALRENEVNLPRDWIIDGGRVYSWNLLCTDDWSMLVETAKAREEPVSDFCTATDAATRMLFIRLLNRTLRACLYPRIFQRTVKGRVLWYFAPFETGQEREYRFQGRKKQTSHTVVSVRMKRDQAREVYSHRSHAAFFQFRNFGRSWFLDIEPTYYFTTDGETEHPHSQWLLSGIKRIEGQGAILGQVRLWAALLRQDADLFNRRHKVLGFGELRSFESEIGIDEGAWRLSGDAADGAALDDGDEADDLSQEYDEAMQLGLFGDTE